jgi:DNA-binding GntR family transcriptional regulator
MEATVAVSCTTVNGGYSPIAESNLLTARAAPATLAKCSENCFQFFHNRVSLGCRQALGLNVLIRDVECTHVTMEERPHLFAPLAKPADGSGRIATTLRHAIIGGDLAAGERLVPERIAEELGSSRPLVVAAMRRLEREGLVTIGSNGRPHVIGLTSKYIADLHRFRLTLDEAVVLAVPAGILPQAAAELRRITSMMKAHAEEGALTAFVQLDLEFHTGFLSLADNPFLLNAWHTVSDVTYAVLTVTDRLYALQPHIANVDEEILRRARARAHTQAQLPQVAHTHLEILESVCVGDGARTLTALRRHYDEGEEALIGPARDLALARVVVDGLQGQAQSLMHPPRDGTR